MYMNLARWCFRHRRIVVVSWVAAIVLAGVAVGAAGTDFRGDPEAPDTESRDGFEVLDEHLGRLPGQGLLDPASGVAASITADAKMRWSLLTPSSQPMPTPQIIPTAIR